ncbi:MAG: M23 family metallopeptidase [Polaribacter sp.]
MRYLVFVFFLSFFSCTQSQKTPDFISFEFKNDSTNVIAKNTLGCPTHLIIKDLKNNKKQVLDFKTYENKKIITAKKDTLQILKDYKFRMLYGTSTPLKKYDTLYNYALPFLKGKRYKVLQGQNTNFTHKGLRSRYAIDFKMNVGQTICAIKDGVVISVKQDSDKGGKSKKYFNDGNYILIYHNDGLFTQYVHLKKNGVLVKRGDSVKKHQPIGYSGNTGMSTEPHLHFGVYKTTPKGFISIPFILNSIPTRRYKKDKFASHN